MILTEYTRERDDIFFQAVKIDYYTNKTERVSASTLTHSPDYHYNKPTRRRVQLLIPFVYTLCSGCIVPLTENYRRILYTDSDT